MRGGVFAKNGKKRVIIAKDKQMMGKGLKNIFRVFPRREKAGK